MNKRGQYFLFAAVVIVALIMSFSTSLNKVTVNDEPNSFYDFSYEAKREVGAVIDYEIYSGFDPSANLTQFIDLLAHEIEERSPGSDFIFIYGNSTKVELKNYGSESVYADGEEIVGLNSDITSTVCLKAMCQDIDEDMVNFDSGPSTDAQVSLDWSRLGSNNVTVNVEGNNFEFPFTEHRQVVFVMQKQIDGDRHLVVV